MLGQLPLRQVKPSAQGEQQVSEEMQLPPQLCMPVGQLLAHSAELEMQASSQSC